MVYSLKAGGKRIRPIACFCHVTCVWERRKQGYSTACAMEMIHTYSLIHDDLPAWMMMIYDEVNQRIIKYLVKQRLFSW